MSILAMCGLMAGLGVAAVAAKGGEGGEAAARPVAATASSSTAKVSATPGLTASTESTAPETGRPAGVTSAAGGCGRTRGSTPVSRTTRITLPHSVIGNGGQADTERLPMAITPRAGGGSWIAWLGTGGKVYLAKLDCQDKLTGTPTAFAGIDLQDVKADSTGGVLLLTRKGSCHTGPLCGGSSSPCNTMHMVRFDSAGKPVWARQVTNLTKSRGGYTAGARFVWWYQHHGRLAYDGTNYAAYFSAAFTVRNGNCVDIHEGDSMQVVNRSGQLLGGHGSFDGGCSHSWTTRIVWDPRTDKFVMACATDNQCRIARPAPYRTIAAGRCDGTLFGGDLVLASSKGYWTAWSLGGWIRLNRFGSGAANAAITTTHASAHPHLVRYGPARMLLTWKSGSGTRAQVYSAVNGRAIGGSFRIAAQDHSFQAWKAYSDYSVAFPAAGSGGRSVTIARVFPVTA